MYDKKFEIEKKKIIRKIILQRNFEYLKKF